MNTRKHLLAMGASLLAACTLLLPLSAPAADGSLVADHEGKVVIVDFWASWCGPCRRSFPWMNDMLEKYGDQGLVVIAVNLDKERAAAEAFLGEVPASFQIHYDPDAALAREYDVQAMPSSFIFGRDGQLVARHLGFKIKKQDEYEAVLVNALGGTP